jgi:hypothetical protein
VLAAVALLLGSGVAAAQTRQNGWRTECVGNYLLDLPGEFDYALSDVKAMFAPGERDNGFYYADGQKALFSSLSLAGGAVAVTPAQPAGVFGKLESVLAHHFSALAPVGAGSESPRKLTVEGGFAWAVPGGAELYLRSAGHLVNYTLPPQKGPIQKQVKRFAGRLQPRAHFAVPEAGSALCLPHALIKGVGGQSHRVAVTLRLKAYPDVEIYFKDESVGEPEGRIKENEYSEATADEAIRSFMTWRYSAYAKRAAADWQGIHPLTLAGRKGKGVFMRILRKDRTRDYGYLAYVKGEPSAGADKPNLMLYVFGDAARADGVPLNKETLRDLAEKIVASVKRRRTPSR